MQLTFINTITLMEHSLLAISQSFCLVQSTMSCMTSAAEFLDVAAAAASHRVSAASVAGAQCSTKYPSSLIRCCPQFSSICLKNASWFSVPSGGSMNKGIGAEVWAVDALAVIKVHAWGCRRSYPWYPHTVSDILAWQWIVHRPHLLLPLFPQPSILQ